jgi:DNA repair exonuclease SbcCD ATPase subunit
MTSQQNHDYTPAEGLVRISRHLSRQDILNEKRQRHTDILPAVESDGTQSGGIARQLNPLRDENRRLRRELEILQQRLAQQREIEDRFEHEIETIHHGHRLEIEEYQNSLRELMEELNQKQDTLQELNQRYQELEHSFHTSIEEETRKLLAEAAQTMEQSPGYTPPLLQGVMATLEHQLKGTEEHNIGEVTALMRQMQRKNDLLEKELARERESIEQERQQLLVQQLNIREQGKVRQQYVAAKLSARFTAYVAIVSTTLLAICVFAQLILIQYFKIPQYWALFSPIFLCALLALVLARTGSKPDQKKTGKRP